MALHPPALPASHAPATVDLHAWASAYPRLHIDLGTGDGAYASYLARRDPTLGVIGVDTNLDRLRGSSRRRPGNACFVAADATRLPPGLLPRAGNISICFPYGSLLRGLVDGDRALLAGLDALLLPGGRLEVRVNASALVASGCDAAGGPAAIASALRGLPGARVTSRPLARAELRVFPSSWSKRLGFGREAAACLVEVRREHRD